MKKIAITRRNFLRSASLSAVTFPQIITSSALGANGVPAASNRIVMAGLGMGGRGNSVLTQFLAHKAIQVVAVNDVQRQQMNFVQSRVNAHYGNSDCSAFEDYREILGRSDIDMVFCAPPDHWHAQMIIDACKAGKDVMCEKPLTLTIGEGRKIVDAARKYQRIAAGGSQRVLEDYGSMACKANSGEYGKILEGNADPGTPPFQCHLGSQPIPKGLNWDFWLGPAPWAPYHERRISGDYDILGKKGWRSWEDYSGGRMTDWGGHKFGGLLHGMKLDHTGPCEIIPPSEDQAMQFRFSTGQAINVRDNFNYRCEGGEIRSAKRESVKVPHDLRWYASGTRTLVEDFIHCVKTRQRPFRDVEWAHRTASLCHLGNIALKLNRSLKWNPYKEDFINDAEASTLVNRARRGPWQI
tara:strand:- start:136 stop:1368 length:1233 start_codon:yes stop_codon:yes gene_type:complete